MNFYFVASAVLLIAIGAAHSWLGERYILMRLFRRENIPHLRGSDEFTKRTLRFAWHITTIAWFGTAALLLILATFPRDASVRLLSIPIVATFLVSGVVVLIASRGRHLAMDSISVNCGSGLDGWKMSGIVNVEKTPLWKESLMVIINLERYKFESMNRIESF